MIEKVNKQDILLLYTLNEKNKEDLLSIVIGLLSKQKNYLFLKIIIAGDKKWTFYDDFQCQSQWIDKDDSIHPTPRKKSYAMCIQGLLSYYLF